MGSFTPESISNSGNQEMDIDSETFQGPGNATSPGTVTTTTHGSHADSTMSDADDPNKKDSDKENIDPLVVLPGCICDYDDPDEDPSLNYAVKCVSCKIMQHPACMGFGDQPDPFRGPYHCHECLPKRHKETVEALASGEKIWIQRQWREQWSRPERQSPDMRPMGSTDPAGRASEATGGFFGFSYKSITENLKRVGATHQ